MSIFFQRDSLDQSENSRREFFSDEIAALLQSIKRPRWTRASLLYLARSLLILSLLASIVFGSHLIWQSNTGFEPTPHTARHQAVSESELASENTAATSLQSTVFSSDSEQMLVFASVIFGFLIVGCGTAACLLLASRRYVYRRWMN